MRKMWGIDPGWGVTAVRVAMAIILIVAGYQKWFQFGVFTGVPGAFAKYGMPLPGVLAFISAVMELGGGICLLLGLLTRWIGLYFVVQFIVATFFVQFRLAGFLGGRLELMLLAAGLMLFLAGPGRAALDEAWLEKEA
jgi:putative oxidoreductase